MEGKNVIHLNIVELFWACWNITPCEFPFFHWDTLNFWTSGPILIIGYLLERCQAQLSNSFNYFRRYRLQENDFFFKCAHLPDLKKYRTFFSRENGSTQSNPEITSLTVPTSVFCTSRMIFHLTYAYGFSVKSGFKKQIVCVRFNSLNWVWKSMEQRHSKNNSIL